MDPDKKVEEVKKVRRDIYQSSQNSKPFENEGSEYDEGKEDEKGKNNDIKENADFDKIKGTKK